MELDKSAENSNQCSTMAELERISGMTWDECLIKLNALEKRLRAEIELDMII